MTKIGSLINRAASWFKTRVKLTPKKENKNKGKGFFTETYDTLNTTYMCKLKGHDDHFKQFSKTT